MGAIEAITVSPEMDAWLRETRRYLHRNPELSLQETQTVHIVAGHLRELGIAPASAAMGARCSCRPKRCRRPASRPARRPAAPPWST